MSIVPQNMSWPVFTYSLALMRSRRMKSLPSSETLLKASSSKSQSQERTFFRVSTSFSPANGERPDSLRAQHGTRHHGNDGTAPLVTRGIHVLHILYTQRLKPPAAGVYNCTHGTASPTVKQPHLNRHVENNVAQQLQKDMRHLCSHAILPVHH